MYKLVSELQQRRADQDAVSKFHFPNVVLMEQASAALAQRISGQARGPIAVLAGSGNNGGDAWGVARYLALQGQDVHVVVWGEPRTAECQAFSAMARALKVPESLWGTPEAELALKRADLWVDGIFGAGFRPPIKLEHQDLWRTLLALCSSSHPQIVAIDVPSGLSPESSSVDAILRADLTLSPGWRKLSCFRPGVRFFCGMIEELPLGYPEQIDADAWGLEASDLGRELPVPPPGSHKGTRGRVGLLGGAPGMSGALVLAARSAAASGAGIVLLWTDSEVASLVAAQVPEFQVRSGSPARQGRSPSAWVVGPGWGDFPSRVALLASVLDSHQPVVIDADGLKAWAAHSPQERSDSRSGSVILTPHPGEMRQLLEGADPSFERVRQWSDAQGVSVVLKDATTWIFSPGELPCVWDGQNPALGTGGSGDCLAGVLGGLLARGLAPGQACRAAVILHALAGASLARSGGWFTAGALPEEIARICWNASQK